MGTWSPQQLEYLEAMGLAPLRLRDAPAVEPAPPALVRAARGVDLTPLLATGTPRDAAARRRFWQALRPLRKAARAR